MFSEPYDHKGPKRRGINSVEQGVSVLQAVVELRKASSLKDIARAAGMDSSRTHRYVSSLVNCGILRQDAATGLYDLGPTALRTGLAALAGLDTLNEVDEASRQLSRRTGATLHVSVWASDGPTIIRWYHGAPPIYTILTVGSVLTLTTSATGRVFLAFLPDRLLADLLNREGRQADLSQDSALKAERDRVRADHIASVDGSIIPGLRGYSCPVFGPGQALVAVITAIAPGSIAAAQDSAYRANLLAACAELTRKLGGAWTA